MLDVTVVGRHVRVPDGVKDYASEKAEKLGRFHLSKVEVILSNEAARYRAEAIASSRRGKTFVARAEFEDLHGAIDLCLEKLLSQLSRTKGKVREKRVRRQRSMPPAEAESSLSEDSGAREEDL